MMEFLHHLRHDGGSEAGRVKERGIVVADEAGSDRNFIDAGLLGIMKPLAAAADWLGVADEHARGAHRPLYLNTHEPFCLVTVGVQGAGKSHTTAVVLENCMLRDPVGSVVRTSAPMSALVMHFDSNPATACEAATLTLPIEYGTPVVRAAAARLALPRDKMVVLVSPSFYAQRRAFYGPEFDVRPLLLRWSDLTAQQLRTLMRLNDADAQLYVALLLDLLRKYQRAGGVPAFGEFMAEAKEVCASSTQQRGPLEQRLRLLAAVIMESDINAGLTSVGADLASTVAAGTLVVVDLTDPLLAPGEANGVFQVLLEQYRGTQLGGAGKIVVMDEAHRYMAGDAADGLSAAIVNTVRVMRHEGMRVVISSQSPLALAPELLELTSLALLHGFHSADWYTYMRAKIPLPADTMDIVRTLEPGNALVWAAKHCIAHMPPTAHIHLAVRPRITRDIGVSATNVALPSSVFGGSGGGGAAAAAGGGGAAAAAAAGGAAAHTYDDPASMLHH